MCSVKVSLENYIGRIYNTYRLCKTVSYFGAVHIMKLVLQHISYPREISSI